TRMAPELAEFLTALSDRRRIDQRQHLLNMADEQSVKQRFRQVLERAEKHVFQKWRRLCRQGMQAGLDLLVEASHVRRKQAGKRGEVALGIGERRALVVARVREQLVARQGHPHSVRPISSVSLHST